MRVLKEEDRYTSPERKLMKKLASLKHRNVIHETLAENHRKGYFVRIFPSKGTDKYEKYLHYSKTYNRLIYQFLYGDEEEQTE